MLFMGLLERHAVRSGAWSSTIVAAPAIAADRPHPAIMRPSFHLSRSRTSVAVVNSNLLEVTEPGHILLYVAEPGRQHVAEPGRQLHE
jgi:hypothetical protein